MNSLVDTRTYELVRLRNHFQAGGNLLRATVWSFVWFRNFRIYLRLDRWEVRGGQQDGRVGVVTPRHN